MTRPQSLSQGSLVTVHRNIYSVHSRLIGEMVEARVGPDLVEIWYADRKVEELPRLRGRSKHRIDYRHIIAWLTMRCAKSKVRNEGFNSTWLFCYWLPAGGEAPVEAVLRFLMGSKQALNAQEAIRLMEDDAPTPLTTIERLLDECIREFYLRPERPSLAALILE